MPGKYSDRISEKMSDRAEPYVKTFVRIFATVAITAVKYSNMFFAFFLFIYVAISCLFTPTSLYLSIIIFARCSVSLFVDLSAQLCQLCENPPFYFNHVGLHWQHIAAWPNHCWHRNSRTNTWNKIDFVFALNVCQSAFCSVGSIKVFDLLLMEGGNCAPLRR